MSQVCDAQKQQDYQHSRSNDREEHDFNMITYIIRTLLPRPTLISEISRYKHIRYRMRRNSRPYEIENAIRNKNDKVSRRSTDRNVEGRKIFLVSCYCLQGGKFKTGA